MKLVDFYSLQETLDAVNPELQHTPSLIMRERLKRSKYTFVNNYAVQIISGSFIRFVVTDCIDLCHASSIVPGTEMHQ